MNTLKLLFFTLLLALVGCNGSSTDTDAAPADNDSQYATHAQLSQALAAVSGLKAQMADVQIIGKLKTSASRTDSVGRVIDAQGNAVSFGPCPDMGVFQGRGGSDTANPLTSQFEVYKTAGCSGIPSGVFTSYNDVTGLHDVPPYAVWDGPNCTGNMYIETDVPQNTFPGAVLSGGVVFTSPIDGKAYWMQGGQSPHPIAIQSAINTRGGSCGPDVETRVSVTAIPNDVNQSGVPDSLVPNSWTQASP